MGLTLYNSLTRKKEPFEPLHPKNVGMYVCGPTVYDLSHIGHARANVCFDVIYRYLRYLGYQVSYVRNITDIDDKIILRSQQAGVPWNELALRFTVDFEKDMQSLGNLPPTVSPRATDHLPQMISLIEKLIQKRVAYVSGKEVFFRVQSFESYGKLSNKQLKDLEAGARVEIRETKENPLDFTLWKPSKTNEPAWESPWGPGRPGWHLECSAMSLNYLGESFDLHGGGRDLIFPHHENEIAQSEASTGKPFVKYWLHNGFVNVQNEKMSKSTGNFLTIRDILAEQDWEVLRAFLLSVHYRSPIDFTKQSVLEMYQALERYYSTVRRMKEALSLPLDSSPLPNEFLSLSSFEEELQERMNDDFNTAQVFGLLFESIRKINRLLDQCTTSSLSTAAAELIQKMLQNFSTVRDLLGCFGIDDTSFFERNQKSLPIPEEEILTLIEKRKTARQEKNFSLADEIRKQLQEKKIILEDSPDGQTKWTIVG